jgi:transcription antitermination protein NusB
MPSRHRSRQRALQILFEVDMRKLPVHEALESFYESLYTAEFDPEPDHPAPAPKDPFMEALVRGAARNSEPIDEKITAHSAHWRLERMPAVDRNILRLAVFEMMFEGTPAAVVIDEAIELARRFSGDESAPFINGVLDAVRKEIAPKVAGAPGPPAN